MKNYIQGQEEAEKLCKDVENGVASIKRVITLAKKHLSEFEEAKVEYCRRWLHLNRKKFKP